MNSELFSKIKAVMKRNWHTDKKYVGTFSFSIIWPAINTFVMALLGVFIASSVSAQIEYNYTEFLIIGTISWVTINIVFYSVSHSIRNEQKDETLEGIYLAPQGRNALLVGNILYGALFAFFTIIIVLLATYFGFGFFIKGSLLEFVLSMILIVFSVSAIAIVIGALTLLWKESTSLSWAIMDSIVLISGIYYPISTLPNSIQILSRISPLKYSLHVIREIALKGTPMLSLLNEAMLSIIISIILLVIAFLFYIRMESHVIKNKGLKQK